VSVRKRRDTLQSTGLTKTKIVRFGLNPYRTRDERILQWLCSTRPYLRAEAIRNALEAYLNRPAEVTEPRLPTRDARLPQTLSTPEAEVPNTTEKLKRMF